VGARVQEREGIICTGESIGRAKRSGGVFTYRPRLFSFPGFWLTTPGTYVWQAHRIECSGDVADCRREGPVVRFRVG
jgi:hypothetical protein